MGTKPISLSIDDLKGVDVLCRDGGIVRIRVLGEPDAPAVVNFYKSLDPQSIYRRFMTHTLPRDEILLGPLRTGDRCDRVLGAEIAGELVAVGLGIKVAESDAAEVAFAVAKEHQGRGIGTILLEHLAATARDCGRTRFVANTLSSNLGMLAVFEQAGFAVEEDEVAGDVDVVLTIDASADASVARRDLRSHAASVRRVLHPNSVAVVGASRTPGTVGNALLRNLLGSGFTGTVYPVNLRAAAVQGVAAYPSIDALPAVPDLAVVAVPATAVLEVLHSCGEAGVAGVVIVSAGFAESASDGVAAQEELLATARWYGMRLIGPNCVGVVNTDPETGLNATFAPVAPVEGTIGFASQSGALGIAALDRLGEFDLGISTFVSLGNKIDISSNDLLQYWEQDPKTDVVALYLESFGNPHKFATIARQFCRKKPIIAVKSGRTASGRRAASSHTAALASSDVIAESLFREAGIIRVNTLAELFDVSRMLAAQPLPAGSNIAIVGNSGGPGIMAADACEVAGLTVPELSVDTQAQLEAVLLPGAGVSNPVDVIAAASAQHYEDALRIVLADDQVDAVIVIYTDPMVSEAVDIAAAISRAAATSNKPIAANFLAADVGATITHADGAHPPIPVYDFPEPAAVAFGHACWLQDWRRNQTKPSGIATPSSAEKSAAAIDAAMPQEGSQWMKPDELSMLLGAWDIDVVMTVRAATADEAVIAADQIGYPVALKLLSETITHKTDVGGVRLDVTSSEQVRVAYTDMKQRLGAEMDGVVVQSMAQAGTELIIGAVDDPVFGPVVVFGAGGTAAEIWEDRAVAMAPLSRERAIKLIEETKVATFLKGHRGGAAADLDSIADLIVQLGAMLDAQPEIAEIDLNPVIATSDGLQIVDVRCRLQAGMQQRRVERRQLD